MRMRFVFIFNVFISFILLLGCEGEKQAELRSSHFGIINGVETNYESWQSVVAVSSGSILCSGTLIHPQVVLTAGHCVRLNDEAYGYHNYVDRPWEISIFGGPRADVVLSAVKQVVPHPEWTGIVNLEASDLALLLLQDGIHHIQPSRLRDYPSPEVGDQGIIVGYGYYQTPEEGGGVHRMGNTSILLVDSYYIEVGGETNTCQGDSGGPLFTQQGSGWVVTGVTSFGMEECPVATGGYDINLLPHCDWLNRTMESLVGENLGLEHCTECTGSTHVNWGQPCGPGHSCCPVGTTCRLPEDFSREGLGYCAPQCCDAPGDPAGGCKNVTSGVAECRFTDEVGVSYCAIYCESDEDCKPGTTCKNKPFESERICIATESGPDPTISCEPEEETSDTEGGLDTVTEADTGKEPDNDPKTVENKGCSVSPVHRSSVLASFVKLLFF